jgi:hypothetical protein
VATLAVCAGFGAGAASAIQEKVPDPFYTGLMRDGRTALTRGDAAAAQRDLRLACFGFLDHPALLAECRLRLGLAQAAAGDRDAFLETFSRLEELEVRFQAYAAAAVTAEERAAFEQKAMEWVEPEVLRSIPAFAPALERKAEADFAKLPPRERQRELERRAAAQPAEPRWKLLLAESELERERPETALTWLAKLPDDAQGGAVGCARGRAFASLERCAEAVKPLAACAVAPSDPVLADLYLACLIELDRPADARAFAATLARPVAARPEVQKRVARIPVPAKPKPEPPPVTAAKPAKEPAKKDAKEPVKKDAKEAQRQPAQDVARKDAKAPATLPAKEPAKKDSRDAAKKDAKEPAAAAAAPAREAPAARPTQAVPGEAKAAAPPIDRAAAAPKLTQAEESAVSDIRKMLRGTPKREELDRALERVRPIADGHRGRTDLQLLAGELAYRSGNWSVGADYLGRPEPGGPSDPTMRFYLAVCQFESGNREAAKRTAASGLEKLQRSPFVDGYLSRIRAGS